MNPEASDVGTVVGVPPSILTTWCSVHVEDSINALSGTRLDYPIQVNETFLFQDPWVHVIFEVAIVNCDTDAVQPQRLKEDRVLVPEDIFQKL